MRKRKEVVEGGGGVVGALKGVRFLKTSPSLYLVVAVFHHLDSSSNCESSLKPGKRCKGTE